MRKNAVARKDVTTVRSSTSTLRATDTRIAALGAFGTRAVLEFDLDEDLSEWGFGLDETGRWPNL